MSKPEVAIVGIGIHPFGRTPERTGQEQGVYAVRQALKDAGLNGQMFSLPLAEARQLELQTLWSRS